MTEDAKRQAIDLAKRIAKEVGGEFWETHRLNVGLLRLIKQLESAPEKEGE